jgi:hypothetical protein
MNAFMKHTLCILLFILFSCYAAEKKLYIFLPTEYTAIDVERKFSEKYDCFIIHSFGSVSDFIRAVSSDTPDAVITKPQLLPLLDSYHIKLNATLNGRTEESYSILSIENPLLPGDLTNKNIGILDFLGKKNITALTEDLFDGSPRLKRVKKIADLIPLLTMDLVDGVIVSATQVAYIRSKSQLTFHEAKCKNEKGIAVLALFDNSEEIVKNLKELPVELALMIGVDGWE